MTATDATTVTESVETTETPAAETTTTETQVEATTATETAEATETSAEATEATEEAKAPEGAPETYDAFELPEGVHEGFELDAKIGEAITTVSRELDLPQASAQALVNQLVPAYLAREAEKVTELNEQWTAELKADKEFGGDNFEKNMGTAIAGVKAAGGDDLVELLRLTPLGSHPLMVKAFKKVGDMVSEDTIVGGGAGGGAIDPRDTAAMAEGFYTQTHT